MNPTCNKCGAVLEYDPGTGCMECPNDKYARAWVEAEYLVAGWPKVEEVIEGEVVSDTNTGTD